MTLRHAPTAPTGPNAPQHLCVGDVALDLDGLLVRVGEKAKPLTFREFLVLRHLMTHAGRVLGRDEITRAAWGPHRPRDRSVDIYIRRLRRHLGDHDDQLERHIRTVHSVGYLFRAEPGLER